MKELYNLKERIMDELRDIDRKGELGAGDLELVHKLTDTVKNIDKICMLEDEGYSQAGDWTAEMRGNYGRESSYANRGQHYVRAHYARDGYDHRGYSRGSMVDHLREMMDDAKTDRERDAIRRCMDAIQ